MLSKIESNKIDGSLGLKDFTKSYSTWRPGEPFVFEDGGMSKIPLTQGKHALVDNEDFEQLKKWKWFTKRTQSGIFYAWSRIGGGNIYMHRVVMKAEQGQVVHHKDGNGLNNQKDNLQICSYSLHGRANRPRKDGRSKYKGVYRQYGKWGASIRINGKKKYLGYYKLEEDAARAYNREALKIAGDLACLNEVTRGRPEASSISTSFNCNQDRP